MPSNAFGTSPETAAEENERPDGNSAQVSVCFLLLVVASTFVEVAYFKYIAVVFVAILVARQVSNQILLFGYKCIDYVLGLSKDLPCSVETRPRRPRPVDCEVH